METHLIYPIRERKARFEQLHFKLRHIARKVFAEQLRQLEEDGIVQRREFLALLPHVEYRVLLNIQGRTSDSESKQLECC